MFKQAIENKILDLSSFLLIVFVRTGQISAKIQNTHLGELHDPFTKFYTNTYNYSCRSGPLAPNFQFAQFRKIL